MRSLLADGLLRDEPNNYGTVIQGLFTPLYQPQDAYVSELVASVSQINAGVTTTSALLLIGVLRCGQSAARTG